MRYLAPLVFIGLFALGIHFVNKSTPLMDAPDDVSKKAQKLQDVLDKKFDGKIPEQINPSDSMPNDLAKDQTTKIDDKFSEDPTDEDSQEISSKGREDYREADVEEENDYEDQDLQEYSEKVSDEDFSEFLGAALEEISEDPEMARAIVVEMAKIYQVQPDHQQKIIQFYEDCARSSKIPDEIKNVCDRERYNLK